MVEGGESALGLGLSNADLQSIIDGAVARVLPSLQKDSPGASREDATSTRFEYENARENYVGVGARFVQSERGWGTPPQLGRAAHRP